MTNDYVGIPLAVILGLLKNKPDARQLVVQIFSTIDKPTTEKVVFYSKCSELGTSLADPERFTITTNLL